MKTCSLVECGKLKLRLSSRQIFFLPRAERYEGGPQAVGEKKVIWGANAIETYGLKTREISSKILGSIPFAGFLRLLSFRKNHCSPGVTLSSGKTTYRANGNVFVMNYDKTLPRKLYL